MIRLGEIAKCVRCGEMATAAEVTGRGAYCGVCEFRNWRATIGSLNAPQG